MFNRQREKWADTHVIALVEFDMQNMRVRIILAREAIRERMRELEHPTDHHGERKSIEGAPDNCGLEEMKQEQRTS